jgi:hypothetical protein
MMVDDITIPWNEHCPGCDRIVDPRTGKLCLNCENFYCKDCAEFVELEGRVICKECLATEEVKDTEDTEQY